MDSKHSLPLAWASLVLRTSTRPCPTPAAAVVYVEILTWNAHTRPGYCTGYCSHHCSNPALGCAYPLGFPTIPRRQLRFALLSVHGFLHAAGGVAFGRPRSYRYLGRRPLRIASAQSARAPGQICSQIFCHIVRPLWCLHLAPPWCVFAVPLGVVRASVFASDLRPICVRFCVRFCVRVGAGAASDFSSDFASDF